MNIKFGINKLLGSGLGCQILFFSLLNLIVFLVFTSLYFLIGTDCEIGWWESLRLFVDSNSILDDTHANGQYICLLFIECLGTILFSGLIVSVITNVISQRVDSIKEGHVHYKFKDHIVIIGYDTIVPSLIAELIDQPDYGKTKIVLQTSSPVEEIRNDLLSKLSKKSLKRVILIHAPRLSVEELELLHTTDAREIFIVGDRTQSDHDAENIYTFETLAAIHERIGTSLSKPLTTWFENEASYAAMQLNDINAIWKKYFEFKPYNFYKGWANRLLTTSAYGKGVNAVTYPKIDHEGISADSSKHIHLIIIGMNRMGIALAKEAAYLMNFPNFEEDSGKNRTRITFIDDNADREMNFFVGRHPGYFDIAPIRYADLSESHFTGFQETYRGNGHNFLDTQFEFIKGRVESEFVRDWLKEEIKDDNAIVSIAVCLHNASQSFGMAMYLPEEVYTRGRDEKKQPWQVTDKDKVINIFVRQEKTGALVKAFSKAAKNNDNGNKKYANLYPFGMVDDSFALDRHNEYVAMSFDYIYDFHKNNGSLPECIPSTQMLLPKWKTFPASIKWSNLYLADSIEFKLRSLGHTEESIKSATPSEEQIERMAYTEHCRWNMEKLLIGYRPLNEHEKHGGLSNRDLKDKMFIHHLIRPYKELLASDMELDRNIIKMLPIIFRNAENNAKH